MKEQLLKMKHELKNLAHQIKTLKPEHRLSQREYSLFENSNKDAIGVGYHRPKGFWDSTIGKDYVSLGSTVSNKHTALTKAQYEFRHKHIAYCLLRGKTIEQIETVGKGPRTNAPDMKFVMKILKEVQDAVAKT